MFYQKFKTGLRFLGILLMRVLLGVVAGFFWLAFLTFIAGGVGWIIQKIAYRGMDSSYNSILEATQRYGSMTASVFQIYDILGQVGAWLCVAVGILWGFSQGRLNLSRWLRRRHA